MTSAQLIPVVLVPLIGWRVYRRFRRNVGRQKFRARRLKIFLILISAILGILVAPALGHPLSGLGLLAGLLAGAGVGLFGFRLTRFENTPEGQFYTPNSYLGITVTSLLLWRLAYRLISIRANPELAAHPSPTALTMLIFGLTAGYFIAYNASVLQRFNKQPPEAVL